MKREMEKILFYVKDLEDNSVWAIDKYDTSANNRLGWLNGKCVDSGIDPNNYVGADIGMDAERAFTNDKYDISKHNKF